MSRIARNRRVLRYETHSVRAGLAIAVASLIIVVCLFLATEMVLQIVGRAPLFLSPTDTAPTGAAQATDRSRVMVPVGIGGVLVGMLLLLAAILPGRRTRRGRPTDRPALMVVLDDAVIASVPGRSTAVAAPPDAVRDLNPPQTNRRRTRIDTAVAEHGLEQSLAARRNFVGLHTSTYRPYGA